MPTPRISRYPTPGEIQEVIHDLEILRSGGSIYFVVDPFEIVTYCFPVNPDSMREYDISSVADHQTALYEVFYGNTKARPLLLDEYAEEIEKYVAFVKANVSEMYSQLEMLDALIEQAELGDATKANRGELLETLEDSFGVLLAIVMGIFSLGSKRLFDVTKRLVRLEDVSRLPDVPQDERKAMEEMLSEYRETELTSAIFNKLNSDSDQKLLDAFAQQRKHKADRRDARAVDRLSQLNSSCERAFRRGVLKHRHMFLYLSSARKSKTVFAMDAVRKALPVVDGKKFSFLRSSAQLFCYAVQKSADVAFEPGIEKTIKNLEFLQSLVQEASKLEQGFSADRQSECKRCILEGGKVESCRWLGICTRVRDLEEAIFERQSQIDNLGLLSSVQKYQKLMNATAGSGEQKELLEVFKDVYRSQKMADRALERMRLLQRLTVSQSEFTKMLPKRAQDGTQNAVLERPTTTAGRPLQLPTQARISSPQYKRIVDMITEAYAHAGVSLERKQELLDKACEEYLALDATMKGANAEHEVMRCFLFLCFLTAESDRKAFDHAVTQLTQPQFAACRAEFYYLTYFAARHLRLYGQVDGLMNDAIRAFPSDARFPYSKASNAFRWLIDEHAQEECPYGVPEILELTLHAVHLYEAYGEKYIEFVAGNYNNLAYFSAFDTKSSGFDLAKSHAYLEKLLTILPRDKWSGHPEYFHTEAFILWRDFEAMDADATAASNRRGLLTRALELVSEADRIEHDSSYGDLKRKIRAELRQLKPKVSDGRAN